MAKKYRVTYDFSMEDAFNVHKDGKLIKFVSSPRGLYFYKPNYHKNSKVIPSKKQSHSTLSSNETNISLSSGKDSHLHKNGPTESDSVGGQIDLLNSIQYVDSFQYKTPVHSTAVAHPTAKSSGEN